MVLHRLDSPEGDFAETEAADPARGMGQSEAMPSVPGAAASSSDRFLGNTPPEQLTRLSVVIPIYNERLTLRSLMQRVLDSPVPLQLEVVAVDDCSTDGSAELLQQLATEDRRIVAVRHQRNLGKGAAIRTALERVRGDIVIVQDADLEYDPAEYARLLEPILQGRADAVFGSRFRGESRRVLFFWHTVANSVLTLLSNMATDLNLTDMETCYKAIRTDVLRNLRLSANSFTIEPELTARLAQWQARIYEVPISYHGRTYAEGKKIRARDAVKACWQILRTAFLDTQFTDHNGFYTLTAVAEANNYNRWTLEKVQPFLGQRLLEAGAGIGNLSQLLLHRERLVLADYEPLYLARLSRRFGHLEHVRIHKLDLTNPADYDPCEQERLDTIYCSNVLEHIAHDESVLARFQSLLRTKGHCIIVVPADPRLYTSLDAALGHHRRYSRQELSAKMEQAGFRIVYAEQFNRLGAAAWYFSGNVLRRRSLSPRQMIWFDRLLPAVKVLERGLPVPGMSLIVVGQKI